MKLGPSDCELANDESWRGDFAGRVSTASAEGSTASSCRFLVWRRGGIAAFGQLQCLVSRLSWEIESRKSGTKSRCDGEEGRGTLSVEKEHNTKGSQGTIRKAGFFGQFISRLFLPSARQEKKKKATTLLDPIWKMKILFWDENATF